MNKRIASLMLCFVLIFTMLATAVPVLAAGTSSFTITADKAEANPGDTITYTVTMGAVNRLDSLKFKLVIPEGLTFVTGSGTLATGLKDTLKCVDTAWTESTKVFYVTMCDEGTGYSSSSPTELMRFQCTVDAGVSGNLTVDFTINPNDCYDSDYDNITFATTPATITVAAAHEHTFGAWVDEVPATCKTTGTKGHKDCTGCSKHFDAEGNEITDLTIPVNSANHEGTLGDWVKTDPDKHWKEYSCCHVKVEEGTHDYDDDTDTECNTCGYERTVAHEHTFGAWVDEVPATCKTTGTKGHKDCTGCNKHFDADGNEITDLTIPVDPDNHTFGTWVDEVPATCKTTGMKGHKDCTGCNKHFDADGNEITDLTIPVNSANHEGTLGDWVKTDPDKHWKEYSCCGAKVGEAVHDYDDDTDTTCNTCDYERTVTPPAHEHICGDWQSNRLYHWKVCATCGEKVEKARHDYGTDRTCDICGYVKPRTNNSTTPSQPTDTTTKSADTGDMGIALYAGMTVLSLTGGAWVINKKRKSK